MSTGVSEALLVRRLREARLLCDAGHLTLRQIAVLALSAGPDEKLRTVAAMAGHMETHKPAVTRAADALEKRGFLRRRFNPKDLRVVFLDISADGRLRLAKVMAAMAGDPPPETLQVAA
ncbi:MarR family transcriptional regulator [Falsiroseomonas sp.]|uniref:MarR family transcriptional regulator n=1 Tax=Falsiroseomonas sp. TaxID=2870721 RepID=UPI0027362CE9|nr:MarR family transcriptional regulator [Falsiroseomonas sp.]MDP3417888.1 MarR family transcriptional regulator [Falsiroseomonas sp.]